MQKHQMDDPDRQDEPPEPDLHSEIQRQEQKAEQEEFDHWFAFCVERRPLDDLLDWLPLVQFISGQQRLVAIRCEASCRERGTEEDRPTNSDTNPLLPLGTEHGLSR